MFARKHYFKSKPNFQPLSAMDHNNQIPSEYCQLACYTIDEFPVVPSAQAGEARERKWRQPWQEC
jgi:hypothetical protein